MKALAQLQSALKGYILQSGEDGFAGYYTTAGKSYKFIFSFGGGWEHLSISTIGEKRIPNWQEMCMFKDLFWLPEECVVQYHPAKSEYINNHPGVLHLWRPINEKLPTPPLTFV